jgi:hypothetical protein
MGDQRQVTVRMLGGCTAIETISTCPDRPWGPLCAMMGHVTLAVVVSTLIFESVGRLNPEDNEIGDNWNFTLFSVASPYYLELHLYLAAVYL